MYIFHIWSLNPNLWAVHTVFGWTVITYSGFVDTFIQMLQYISFDQFSVRFYEDITSNIKKYYKRRDNALSLNIFDTYFQICWCLSSFFGFFEKDCTPYIMMKVKDNIWNPLKNNTTRSYLFTTLPHARRVHFE